MSSARHAVIRGPSLTLFGNRPDLTPAHQVDLLTGNTAKISGNLINPVWGIAFLSIMILLCLMKDKGNLCGFLTF